MDEETHEEAQQWITNPRNRNIVIGAAAALIIVVLLILIL